MANHYLSINLNIAGGSDDRRVKVSSDDTTPAFLEDKVVAGSTKVTVTTTSPGGDEKTSIDVDQTMIDHDLTANYVLGQHRIINDAGTSATELWSASKIDAALAAQDDAAEIGYTPNDAADWNVVPNKVAPALDETVDRVVALEADTHTHSNKAVLDATTASFLTADETKLDGIETAATADQSAAEIKVAYESNADTNEFSDAEQTKLANLGSAGDLNETSFAGALDTASSLDVTGLAFANGVVRSFEAKVSVSVDATADLFEEFNISGIQKGADWDIAYDTVGDDSLVTFDITAAGQLTYTKATTAGWVSTTINFRAITTSV